MKRTWFAAVVVAGVILAGCGNKEKEEEIAVTDLQVRVLRLALDRYELDTGSFPTTSQGLQVLVKKPADLAEGKWKGPYLDTDTVYPDAWQRPFNYEFPGKHKKAFDLWSNGPDGKSGTGDDVVNWD